MEPHVSSKTSTDLHWLGSKCRVRDFRRADAANVYAFASDPAVSLYMNWDPHACIAVTRRYLAGVCRKKGKMDTPLAIATKQENRCCGFVGFTHVEAHHRRADIAFGLSPAYQGRGIAKQACQFLIARAKEQGLVRLQAVVEEGNEASRALMTRLGAQQEGLLKRYLVAKRGIVDAYLYAFYL